MEIYLREFNKKFMVKQSNKNMRKTYELQLKMAQTDDVEGKKLIEQIKLMLELTDAMVDYAKSLLKLNAKQQEVLDGLESDATFELINHITQRMLGMSEQDIKDAENEDVDPKK
jgi:predicted esterase YcpF (UPF0227 family)